MESLIIFFGLLISVVSRADEASPSEIIPLSVEETASVFVNDTQVTDYSSLDPFKMDHQKSNQEFDFEKIHKSKPKTELEQMVQNFIDKLAKKKKTVYFLKCAFGLKIPGTNPQFQIGKTTLKYDLRAGPKVNIHTQRTEFYFFLQVSGKFGGSSNPKSHNDDPELAQLKFEFMRLNYLSNVNNWVHIQNLPTPYHDVGDLRDDTRFKLIRMVRKNPRLLKEATNLFHLPSYESLRNYDAGFGTDLLTDMAEVN